jgi:predicted RNase H-like nuclease
MEVVWLPECQQWAFEVHPEVCFWALNQHRPMLHNKKTEAGRHERLNLLRTVCSDIQRHLLNRPPGVGKDDLLDATVTAWTALRRHRGKAVCVYPPERDEKGLALTICC